MVSYKDRRIPDSYIQQLPNGKDLSQLIEEAQTELSTSTIIVCDIDKYPEANKPKSYGRYEQKDSWEIIWIRLGLPDYVTEFVLAHELGHLFQKVRGYPRVSIRDLLRNFKVYNEQKELVHPDIIVRIHWLTDGISNLLLDPGADKFANNRRLLTNDALKYLKCKYQASINRICLPDFHSPKFQNGLKDVLKNVKGGVCPPSPFDMCGLLETARLATIYATLQLRYNRYGLFDSIDQVYKQNLPMVRKLGIQLAHIACSQELERVNGCTDAGRGLLLHLRIPEEAVALRIGDNWIT